MMTLSKERALDPFLLDCRLDDECCSNASSSVPPALNNINTSCNQNAILM